MSAEFREDLQIEDLPGDAAPGRYSRRIAFALTGAVVCMAAGLGVGVGYIAAIQTKCKSGDSPQEFPLSEKDLASLEQFGIQSFNDPHDSHMQIHDTPLRPVIDAANSALANTDAAVSVRVLLPVAEETVISEEVRNQAALASALIEDWSALGVMVLPAKPYESDIGFPDKYAHVLVTKTCPDILDIVLP